VAERWQRRKDEPLADSTVRAWRQSAQRPTGSFGVTGLAEAGMGEE